MNANERIEFLENQISMMESEKDLLERQIEQCQHTLVEIHSGEIIEKPSWCGVFMNTILKKELMIFTVKRMKCSICGYVTHINFWDRTT